MRKFLNQLDLMLLEMIAEQKFQRQRDLIQLMRLINLMSLHLQGPMLLEMMIADPMYRSLQDLMVNKMINLKSHLPPDLMLLETKADPIFLHLPDPTLQMRQINLMFLNLQGPMLQEMIVADPMFQRLRDLMPLMRQMFHHQRLDQVMTLNLTHQPHLL